MKKNIRKKKNKFYKFIQTIPKKIQKMIKKIKKKE